MPTLSEAKTTISSYDESYSQLLSDLVTAKQNLATADALLDSLIASGASSSTIQTQNNLVTSYESTINTKIAAITALNTEYQAAQSVVNASLSLPDPDTISVSPYVGATGPTGPSGSSGVSVTGPTGATGMQISSATALTAGSLAVSTSLTAPSASFSNASITSFTSASASVSQLTASSASIGNMSISNLIATNATVGVLTSTTLETDYLTVSGICTAQGLSITSMTSATINCSGGFVGTLITPSQTAITQLGTLSSLSVSGLTTSGSMNVSGVVTCLQGYVGTIITANQPNITQTGVLTSLSVSGVTTTGSLNVTALMTSSGGFVGTLLTASQPNVTQLGTLSSLNVSGITTCTSLIVSGITTASTGLYGTILTPSQPNVTGVGTLTALSVSGSSTYAGTISQLYSGTSSYLSTSSSSSKNSILLATDSGSTQYEIGVRGSGGTPANTFYIQNVKTSGTSVNTDRLVVNSLGYVGIGTSSPNVNLDVGGCTSSMVSSLSNTVGYFGSVGTGGGIAVGAGASSINPFIAATKSSLGTSLGLNLMTADTTRLSIDASGNVSIPGTLAVAGVDFASAIGGMGYNQTWSTFTSASRAMSTTYQNSTTRPILVNASLSWTGVGLSTTSFWVGVTSAGVGTVAVATTNVNATVGSDNCNFSIAVPASQYYKITYTGTTTPTVRLWSELR